MPVLKKRTKAMPTWCELEYFDIIELPSGATYTLPRAGQKQKLIVGKGRCRLALDGESKLVETGANLDWQSDALQVEEVLEPVVLVYMAGRWGQETGGSGLFKFANSDAPQDRGDPVPYAKATNFDCHYHDCDEYWIFFEGSVIAVSEGKRYEVGAGDCVATGMGHHHDIPQVFEPGRAVYFETTLEGQKRRGHLWDHTHGVAQPKLDRV
jgi:mannose-6-phosphate isomerase-like protein (cupin superfamily)